ncbi:MAG: S8 family serine peptidase [Chloroflexi bacterium]|nr:S8 family serine peptidase [Chloroflexota bacterium]
MPLFSANVPYAETFQRGVLSLHERLGASTHYTGRGVVIAFIDSGYYMHPDLGDRILVHADASTNHIIEQHEVMTPDDLSWHGQMTSVVAAGSGWESGGRFKGLAADSRLVLIKITSPRGLVKESDILRGLRWLIDTHVHYGVKVVNLSVGGDFVSYDPEHPIYKAIRKLVDAGSRSSRRRVIAGTTRWCRPRVRPTPLPWAGTTTRTRPIARSGQRITTTMGRAMMAVPSRM